MSIAFGDTNASVETARVQVKTNLDNMLSDISNGKKVDMAALNDAMEMARAIDNISKQQTDLVTKGLEKIS